MLMTGNEQETETKGKRDRPEMPIPRIGASPERVARAMFSAVKPPDPSLRKFNLKKKPGPENS